MDLTQLRAVVAIDTADFEAKMAVVGQTSQRTEEALTKLTETVTQLGEKMGESGHHAESLAHEVEKGFEFGTGMELARKGFEALSDAIKEAGEATLGFVGQTQQWSIIFDHIAGAGTGEAMVAQARESAAAWGLVPEQVFQATKSLEGFGLTGEANLKMIADAAAGSGNSLATVGQQIGLVYANMQEGIPISRFVLQLEREKVLSAETVGQLREMEKAHGDMGKAWALITADLAKFNDAGDQMGKTFPNAVQRIKTEIEDLIGKAFTPLGEAATGAMNKLGAALHSPAVENALIQVEASMQVGVDAIKAIWEQGIEPIVAVAAKWGEALLNTFAQGMTAGLNAVVSVVNALTDILTFWFKPGSPPRFLPYLDEWGTAAMDTYMQGWTKIDTGVFSNLSKIDTGVFSNLSKLVEEELRTAFSQTGGFNLFDAIMGDRTAILDAFNEIAGGGTILEGTMQRIRDASGPIADEVLAQVEAYGQLADITDRLNESTRTLTGLKNAEKEALAAPNARLELLRLEAEQLKINADLAKGPAKGESAEAFAIRMEELRIQKEINQIKLDAKPGIDAEQQLNDKLKDQKGYQEDLVASMKSMADWQKENTKLWDEFHKAASGGGSKGPGFSGSLIPPDVQENIDKAKEAAAKLHEAWKQITEGPNAELLKADWDKVLPILKNIPDEINKIMNPDRWPELAKDFQLFNTRLNEWLTNLSNDPEVQHNAYEIGKTIADNIGKVSELMGPVFSAMMTAMENWIDTNGPAIFKVADRLATQFTNGIETSLNRWAANFDWAHLFAFKIVLPGGFVIGGDSVANQTAIDEANKAPGSKASADAANAAALARDAEAAAARGAPIGSYNPSSGPGSSQGAPRAAGGPVKAGQRYWVGEEGPEPFVPSVDGYILPSNVAGIGSGPTFGPSLSNSAKNLGGASIQLGDIHIHVTADANGKISIEDFSNAVADFGNQVTAMASKALEPHIPYITEGVLNQMAKLGAG